MQPFYTEIVTASLDKIKKVLPKKHFEIKTAIDEATELREYCHVNHLLKVYQLCIESKQIRLVELALFDIKNFMENNLIQGDLLIQGKRTIESLLDLVLTIQNEKEETVQIHMIKALQALMTSRLYHIHGEPVTRVFSLLINLSSVSKIVAIEKAGKEACKKIVNMYFQRLEDFGCLSPQEYAASQLKLGRTVEEDYQIKALVTAEEFMQKLVTSMVDEVQIYSEKCKTEENPNLRVVQPQDKSPLTMEIFNEKAIRNGKFGWCVVCRNSASSYCKDTKVPVCTKECKIIHMNNMLTYTQVFKQAEQHEDYIKDGYEILDMLCQLSQREPQNAQLQPMVLKCKTLSLDLIYEVLAQGELVLQNKPQYIAIMKESLFDSLLKNSLSAEKQLYIMTINIFVQLVWKHRSHLKKEIEAIIENVYFKFLDSSNSNFDHKQYTLKVFNKILTRPKVILDIFVNYDSSVGQNNLLKKMLDNHCKIIQGRYSKPEYIASITTVQDAFLKQTCIENFCQMVKSLKQYCEEQDTQLPTDKPQLQEEPEDYPSEVMEKQRQMKNELNRSVMKFNFKPEHCIKHLIACQFMPDRNPKLFAQFIWENRDLSKDKMGEFFGSDHQFNQSTFSEYVDLMNFVDQAIDEALRNLLEYFTLPCESQQIDRIMQKFASKYVQDNPPAFQSATAAYTLSYLLMMLQTDLHNPQNLEKMTLPQFTNLARGINDGADLTAEVLSGFYTRIQKQPLAVHHKEQARKALELANQVDQRKRHALLAREAEGSLKKWFKEHQNQEDYYHVNSLVHVKFLMEQIWSPVFASISVMLEQSDDQVQISNCFEAIGLCVKLMGKFDLDQEKDTFIFFLQKFCVPMPSTLKQVLGVQTVLGLALNSGQYLRKSWKVVLQLVSRIEVLHSAIKRIKVDDRQFTGEEVAIIERLFQQIDYNQIDKMFIQSTYLDSDSILDFIRALCELSKEDIKSNRTFLLSKVVEVAEFNMNRIKIIWSKMWEIMREHFLEVGSNKNVDLAIYAIDQLKQLSCKFLQQPELANYHFQKEFLVPFEQVFQHSQATTQYKTKVREYILSCMSMITNVCFTSIKSGWKIIMSVVNQALQEEHQALVQLCVQITDKIMLGPLENANEIFMELISALIKLTKTKDLPTVLKSIQQLQQLINFIATDKRKSNEKFLDQIWIPVLSSLSILYSDERIEVQQASVGTLFTLLQDHGANQNPEFWKMILRGVIRPLFDEIQFSKLQKQRQKVPIEQLYSSCKRTFDLLTQLVVEQIGQLQPCLNDLMDIYMQLILQTQDVISCLALESIKTIVEQAGNKFHEDNWSNLIEQIQHILQQCSPRELFEASNLDDDFQRPLDEILHEDPKQKKFSFKVNVQDCHYKQAIQEKALLILVAQVKLFKQTEGQTDKLLATFTDEHQKCKKFNKNLYMRYFLQKQCDYGNDLPGFLEIEFMSQCCILEILKGEQLYQFIDQIVNRCLEAQYDYSLPYSNKDDIKGHLEKLRHSEAKVVIQKSYNILAQNIFPFLKLEKQNKPQIVKWLIQLLKKGLDCSGIDNNQYNHSLVELLESVIELNINN